MLVLHLMWGEWLISLKLATIHNALISPAASSLTSVPLLWGRQVGGLLHHCKVFASAFWIGRGRRNALESYLIGDWKGTAATISVAAGYNFGTKDPVSGAKWVGCHTARSSERAEWIHEVFSTVGMNANVFCKGKYALVSITICSRG